MLNTYIKLILVNTSIFFAECTDIFSLNFDPTSSQDTNCQYADHIINSGNFYYSPSSLNIEAGESVQWNNLSGFHDVVSISGPEIIDISPVSAPALIGSYTFNLPGTYEYICSIGSHANLGMTGSIVVSEPSCEPGFTQIQDYPSNTCIPLDGSNCFSNQDLQVLEDIIELNNLELTPLEIGFQNWSGGRITRLLIGNNSNGGFITLDALPNSIGNLESLVQLYIDDNNLTSLPDNIGNLSNLIYLVANFNNLITLPETIGNLENLTFLDLGYNNLENLPSSIGNLLNLEYLWLFDNNLYTLPNSICNLDIDWDETTIGVSVVPYFGCGGNMLCNESYIPDCIEDSSNFNISLDAAYYLFMVVHEQICEDIELTGDVNLDNFIDVLDIMLLVQHITGDSLLPEPSISLADVNEDNLIDILDIINLVNIIIN